MYRYTRYLIFAVSRILANGDFRIASQSYISQSFAKNGPLRNPFRHFQKFHYSYIINMTYTVKPPNSGHHKQWTCFEQRTKRLVPNVIIFSKLTPVHHTEVSLYNIYQEKIPFSTKLPTFMKFCYVTKCINNFPIKLLEKLKCQK